MKKLLILDSGHAKNTPGKKSPDNSFFEWDFNNKMQYKIKARAEAHGIEVFLSNPNPSSVSDIPLTTRANLMNNYWTTKGKPEAIMISIHSNAYGSDFNSARGTETFHASNASSKSKTFAKTLNSEIVKTMKLLDSGAKDRGVKQEDFTVIYKTRTPCVLAEYAFYSNKSDLNILKNNQDELAEATIKAVCKYFGITYKPVGEKPNSSGSNSNTNSNVGGNKVYENVIVYKGEVDRVAAEIVYWGIKDRILISVEDYKEGLGKKVITVGGGACNTVKSNVKLNGSDRYETVKLALQYVGK